MDQSVCTIVDVFYGTDRAAVPGPDRLSFGGDRANKLTLGHAFVTVPKSLRTKGAIPLPGLWDRYVRGVPPEGDPARHFTIPKNGVSVFSTEAEFLAAAKKHIATAGDFKNHAFIFVHGFYVSFDNALYRTAQIAYDLSPDGRPFGTAFLYSWPSAGNATAYIYDQDSAQFSVPHLQSFLRTVIDKTGVENVHIIAHSMGNVALIGALQEMARTETKAKVNQIILAAPDVDKQQFETVAKSVERVAKGMTLYASQGDNALALARKVRGGTPRAGESLMPPGPAVVAGIDTIDVSAIPTSVFSWGHDSYADSSELLADIAALFVKGDHPPHKRSAKFQLLQQGTLQYWKYAK
jgi:esterase/lipase superfamily enzyme